MSRTRYNAASSWAVGKRKGETMREPEEVAAMVRLHELGWGAKRIARELQVSKNTVKRYLSQGGWAPYRRPERESALGRTPSGSASASGATAAMPTWCARSSRASWG